jgi:hypothetical protein
MKTSMTCLRRSACPVNAINNIQSNARPRTVFVLTGEIRLRVLDASSSVSASSGSVRLGCRGASHGATICGKGSEGFHETCDY